MGVQGASSMATAPRSGHRRQRPSAHSGQNLIELALLLPVFSLLLLGSVDLGRAFIYHARLTHAIMEGAIYGNHFPSQTTTIIQKAYAEANGQLGATGTDFVINTTDVVCYQKLTTTLLAATPPGDCTARNASGTLIVGPGDSIAVTGSYTFHPLTSQIIRVLPANFKLKKTVRMVIQ
jgi:Flp pilus assembly protein TadG